MLTDNLQPDLRSSNLKDLQSSFQELITSTTVTKMTIDAMCCFPKYKRFEFRKGATIQSDNKKSITSKETPKVHKTKSNPVKKKEKKKPKLFFNWKASVPVSGNVK